MRRACGASTRWRADEANQAIATIPLYSWNKWRRRSSYPSPEPSREFDEPEDIVEVLAEYAPFYLKPLLPDVLPPVAGISTDYVSGEKGIPGIGLEIARDQSRYFEGLPASQQAITERHIRGLLYLGESLSRRR